MPQERQCESQCFYTLKLNKNRWPLVTLSDLQLITNGRVAIFHCKYGSIQSYAYCGGARGRLGWSSAGDMVKRGYDVTVFEAPHELEGASLRDPGVSPAQEVVDIEIEGLRKMGVKFITNCIVGKTI